MTWNTNEQPFGVNHAPLMSGLASDGSGVEVPVAVDKSTGELLISGGGSGGTSSNFGSAFPVSGTAAGASDGTDMQPFLVDGSGNLKVAVESGGGGGTQYQELATTSPATGTLALGRYKSSLPTLTNGQMNEPMLDASSRLITNVGANTDGTATGNITSTQTVTIATGGYAAVGVQVTGTWTGQINVQGSVDGTNYIATTMALLASGALVSDLTTNNIAQVQCAGLQYIQMIGATVNTGTAVVTLRANQGTSQVMIDNPLPSGSNLIGEVGITSGGNTAGVDSSSRLSTLAAQPTAANLNATVVGTGTFAVQASQATASSLNATVVGTGTFAAQVASSTATGSAVPADAYYEGGRAATALPTAATAGNLTGAMYDKFGRQIVVNQSPRDLVNYAEYTFTANTSSETIFTPASSTYGDISSIVLTNSGATATLFTLSDGTNNYYYYVPAGDMRGAVYTVPLPATTAATAWTGQCGSSTSSLYAVVEWIANK